MSLQTVQFKEGNKITTYIDELGVVYEIGDILNHIDRHGNFIDTVIIKKFIIHIVNGKRKLFVNLQNSVKKSYNITLGVDYLGLYYLKY